MCLTRALMFPRGVTRLTRTRLKLPAHGRVRAFRYHDLYLVKAHRCPVIVLGFDLILRPYKFNRSRVFLNPFSNHRVSDLLLGGFSSGAVTYHHLVPGQASF